MKKKEYNVVLKILFIFILLQPLLDILSTLANMNYIFNISTYFKPLFVFGLCFYLLFKNPNKKKWLLYIVFFAIYTGIHLLLIYKLIIFNDIILHEFRFMLNIAYMIALFLIFDTIYYYSYDKKKLLSNMKKCLLYTFILYTGLYFVSVITKTSFLTYSYSDASKLGYRGWYFSGQIFGHALSMIFPISLYTILKPERNSLKKIIFILLFVFTACLLGTKVPYYIVFTVLVLYVFIYIIIKIFNKNVKRYLDNFLIVLFTAILMFTIYSYIPVYHNNEINKSNFNVDSSEYDLNEISGINNISQIDQIKEEYPNSNLNEIRKFVNWNKEASNTLIKAMKNNKIHPSENRKKQFLYNKEMFMLSSLKYKIFGTGFLNQISGVLSIEGDFFMAIFNFGLIGFILFLSIPIYYFIKTIIFILKNIKICDLEIYMLFMGLGVFFSISLVVGCTYIYTNFSIFLVLIIAMIRIKMKLLEESKVNIKNNKITFLLLHLGYGGIESSIINTANSLCDKYEIEIMSFYKLDRNQSNKLDDRINVTYLYNGGPNKDEFMNAFHNHRVFSILKEGVKSVGILIKKKIKVIKYIKNCDAKYIVSTRYDFSVLLSKYGNSSSIKIAQEHHYHNNNKKYINILKNKYYNIDYLFALTKTLEKDYKEFLVKNNHTKVMLVPNMLYDIPNKVSKLNNKNIITVSRLDYGKRNDDIIRAFSKLKEKDWKLYIVGDGKEYNNLTKLVKELKLEDRVILTGYKNKEKIEEYMLKSSLFLMASETEGLPMVLLEAMSYGIPCIAYETASGVNDIIDNDKNGYVIKNRDEVEYVEKIEKVITNQKLRDKLGKNAKEKVNEFSKEKIVNIWKKVLK
ncbi:MAG: glycosyltransferase [Bacilli bacterium]